MMSVLLVARTVLKTNAQNRIENVDITATTHGHTISAVGAAKNLERRYNYEKIQIQKQHFG